MFQLQCYTGIWLLLVSSSLSWTDPEEVYENIQRSICEIVDVRNSLQLQNNVNNFEQKWNASLISARKDLKDYKDIWGFSITERDCPEHGYSESFTTSDYSDIKCFIRDLQTIGDIIQEDLVRLDTDANNCGAPVYLQAWHRHPLIERLNCYGTQYYEEEVPTYSLFQYVYDLGLNWNGPLSEWKSDPTQYSTSRIECVNVYSNAVIKGLRKEIDKFCPLSGTKRLCELKICTNLADTAAKLLGYTKSTVPATEHYLNAFLLTVFASVREMNLLHPDWLAKVPNKYGNDYLFAAAYSSDDWANSKVVKLIEYIYESMDNIYDTKLVNGHQLYHALDLLPTNYHCQETAEFGSLCWTLGIFDGMVKALKQNVNIQNKQRKVRVNTAIDYKAFLQHTQQERLLKLSETSQSNLLDIAKELRDDIVHSLNQSLGQSITNSANEVKNAVQTGFGSLRKHFQQEASFDKAIAKADIAFINAEIKKYFQSSQKLSNKVSSLVGNIMYYGFVAATGDNLENAIKMMSHFLSLFNPFKWLTGGTSLVDSMDAVADYTQSLATLLKTDILKEAWNKLTVKTYLFMYNLRQNQAFLENVRMLVESLSVDAPPSNFESLKDEFIKRYNDYSPAVNVEDLAEVTGYWELIIEEGCELIDSTEGTVSGGAKISMGSDCYDAKGEVQKLMALYEEIFEFQFDLMNALAECVRASNSFESANSITAGLDTVKQVVYNSRDSNVLPELRLLAAYSSMLYRMTVLTAKENYCNVIEYREGHRPDVCKTLDWNLASLLSRSQSRYHCTQDFKVVPTRPSFSGDKAFIDLKDLYEGEVVQFQVPNSEWLVKNGWISSEEKDKPIFVQRLEVYLPVTSSSEKQVFVIAEATIGNQLRRDEQENGTEYIISPRRPLTFSYKEGHSSCRNEEIPNPYSSNCRTMPDLCQVSVDLSDSAIQNSIYPSVYAMWRIVLSGYESENLLTPATNMDLMIGLQTCSPSVATRKKRSSLKTGRYRRSSVNQKCCQGNQYVNESLMCEACPPNSVAKYDGLFCECNQCKNGGTVIHDSEQCSCICDSEHEGRFCEIKKCKSGEEFTCNNTECIPLEKYCDKNIDCSDDSDEPEGCVRNNNADCADGFCCNKDRVYCDYLGETCVPNSWVCDGNYDCGSSLDEASCGEESSEECPVGWIFYSGTCFLSVGGDNGSRNGTDAQGYCEEVGGRLADLRKETEHWFIYSLFIHSVSGNTLSVDDYIMAKKSGTFFTNYNYGLSSHDYGFWWVGQATQDLTGFNESDYSADGRCIAIEKATWRYSIKNCSEVAEGFICTYRHSDLTTPAPTQGPDSHAQNGTNGGTNIGTFQGAEELKEEMQDLNTGMQSISKGFVDFRQTMSKGFKEVNKNLLLLLQKLESPTGTNDHSTAADDQSHDAQFTTANDAQFTTQPADNDYPTNDWHNINNPVPTDPPNWNDYPTNNPVPTDPPSWTDWHDINNPVSTDLPHWNDWFNPDISWDNNNDHDDTWEDFNSLWENHK